VCAENTHRNTTHKHTVDIFPHYSTYKKKHREEMISLYLLMANLEHLC
jgi:hypothetical protein